MSNPTIQRMSVAKGRITGEQNKPGRGDVTPREIQRTADAERTESTKESIPQQSSEDTNDDKGCRQLVQPAQQITQRTRIKGTGIRGSIPAPRTNTVMNSKGELGSADQFQPPYPHHQVPKGCATYQVYCRERYLTDGGREGVTRGRNEVLSAVFTLSCFRSDAGNNNRRRTAQSVVSASPTKHIDIVGKGETAKRSVSLLPNTLTTTKCIHPQIRVPLTVACRPPMSGY